MADDAANTNTKPTPRLYIVFSPEGTTPPVKTYDNHGAAHAAAWRMAELHPGQTFFVMVKNGKGAFVDASAKAAA